MADEYVEPAHEALIRAWDKMLEWRKEETEKLTLQRAITQATYGTGGLWTNDKRLSRAEELLAADPYWLNTEESCFIKESLRQRKRNGQTLWGSVIGVILALSLLTIFAFIQRDNALIYAKKANDNATEAKKQTGIARSQTAEAKRQTGIANAKTLEAKNNLAEAVKQTNIANTKTIEAKNNLAEAKKQTGIAQAQTAEAKRQTGIAQAQTAEAKKQGRIAEVRRLAAHALNRTGSRPDIAVALSVRSLEDGKKDNASQEGEEALRTSLRATRGRRIFCRVDPNDFGSDVEALDISPDNTLYAIGTRAGALSLYRPHGDGFQMVNLLHRGDGVLQARFSADNRWLFTVSDAGRQQPNRIRAIEMRRLKVDDPAARVGEKGLREFTFGTHDAVQFPVFDQSGSRIAFYDPDSQSVEVWSLRSFGPEAKPLRIFPTLDHVIAIGLSSDGTHLAALISRDLKKQKPLNFDERQRAFDMRVWSLATGSVTNLIDVLSQIPPIFARDSGFFDSGQKGFVRVSSDGKWVIPGLYIFDQHRGEPQYAADVWNLAASAPKLVQRYDGEYPKEGSETWTRVSNIDIGLDGSTLYAVNDTQVRAWRIANMYTLSAQVTQLTAPYSRRGTVKSLGVIYASAISDDGKYLAVGDSNGSVCVWDLRGLDGSLREPMFFVEPQDPTIRSVHSLCFSHDSKYVLAGSSSGSVQVLSISDRGGSIEPKMVPVPLEEGQWRSVVEAPDHSWIATVSEAQRIHFWHLGHWDTPFFSGSLQPPGVKVPIVSREAMISSGITGRPVAVIPSDDGRWAAAYEVQQYGFNEKLILFRLAGTPRQFDVHLDGLGLNNENAFERVRFDSFLNALWIMDKWGNTALLRLPPVDSDPVDPLRPERIPGKEMAPIRLYRDFIVTGGFWGRAPTLWRRDQVTGRAGAVMYQIPEGSIQVDVAGKWIFATVRQDKMNQSDEDSFHVVECYKISEKQIRHQIRLGNFNGVPSVVLSPNGQWLLVGGQSSGGHDRIITLWRVGAFDAPAGTWRLPTDGADGAAVTAAFDPTSRRFVAGPSAFIVPDKGPPASFVAALLGDLGSGKPVVRHLNVQIGDYRANGTTGGRKGISISIPDIDYEFSDDGSWLTSSNPGNVWHLGDGDVRQVLHLSHDYAVFAPGAQWMVTVGTQGTRLWSLRDGSCSDHGLLGTAGRALFLTDKEHLLRIENGAVLIHTLSRENILSKASVYMGRNLTWNDWQREFPGSPYSKTFSKLPAHGSVAAAYLEQAETAIVAKHIDEARAAYQAAVTWAIDSEDPSESNEVCWSGSIRGFAALVRPAGEFAVKVDPNNGNYHDTRGVARAMTGDLKGALADFEAYLPWAEEVGRPQEAIGKRRRWIEELKSGRRPKDFDQFEGNSIR